MLKEAVDRNKDLEKKISLMGVNYEKGNDSSSILLDDIEWNYMLKIIIADFVNSN